MPPHEALPVFFYGTLQPGGRLYPLVEKSVLSVVPAVAFGHSLYANPFETYPYMVAGKGQVYGHLLVVKRGPDLKFIMQMEADAGYVLTVITVSVEAGNSLRELKALAFIWPGDKPRGELIAGGNWLEYGRGRVKVRVVPSAYGPPAAVDDDLEIIRINRGETIDSKS